MALLPTLKKYYRLTKPGIIYGNALAATAGYFFGAKGNPEWYTFTLMLVGTCLIIASACVSNNLHDRSIDAKMKRTKNRSLVTNSISTSSAVIFAAVLIMLGVFTLRSVSLLALFVALLGYVAYVWLYGWAKRHTVHSTLIGTISGSTPPVIGYAAATGMIDVAALLLFMLLVTWQMPHFYSIAIFRRDDYAAAKLPILSVVKGTGATRKQIIIYALLYLVTSVALGLFAGASLITVIVMLAAGSYWLYLILAPYEDINRWARKQFKWSLLVLLIICVALTIDSIWH